MQTRLAELPQRLVDLAQLRVLDTLGCGLAAHATGNATAPRAALLASHGDGPATVLGAQQRLPAPAASCANGTLCHALDYDDTHAAAIVNVGAIVVPAALAVAESSGASGAELLTAVIVGSEVAVRLGLAAAPSFLESGFHPAAVCGVFGAAAAAARVLGLDERVTRDALAVAGSFAAGTYEPLRAGATTKTLHAGWAAQSGVMAALFAAAGQDGPATVLDGPHGVFPAHFRLPPSALHAGLDELGGRWDSQRISIRPYPICYLAQSSLDAVREAVGDRKFIAAEVREVRASVPAAGLPIVFEPRVDKLAPRSPYEARFSLPYCVGAMLVRGRVGLDAFTDDAIRDPAVLEMAAQVVHEPRDFPSFPASYPAEVTVETTAGELLSARIEHERGGPDNPMSDDQVYEKFRDNVGLALTGDEAQALEDAVGTLVEQPDVTSLSAALRRAT